VGEVLVVRGARPRAAAVDDRALRIAQGDGVAQRGHGELGGHAVADGVADRCVSTTGL